MARMESIEYECDNCATSQPAQHVMFATPPNDFTIPEDWMQVTVSKGLNNDVGGHRLTRILINHYCPECIRTAEITIQVEVDDDEDS